MLVKNTTYFFLVIILGLVVIGCKKAPNYSKEPVIEFDNLKVNTDYADLVDSVKITIKFQDGDGDLGNDPVVPSYFDFFVDLYKKKNGVFTRVDYYDTIPPGYNGYMPLLSPYTLTGPIDGKITYITPPFLAPLPGHSYPATYPYKKDDTLQFHVRIRDRAGNYSNWVESEDYIVWKNF
ncbi:MAG TPA: hypothetical protein VK796_05125 [Cytophaga sp.]|jgi:hypothetical protein|nr:hypothetical protein [Cytophaga sp.]